MKTAKDLLFRIAEKLDQTEKGYIVPTIIYHDTDKTAHHSGPVDMIAEYDTDKYLITVEKIHYKHRSQLYKF